MGCTNSQRSRLKGYEWAWSTLEKTFLFFVWIGTRWSVDAAWEWSRRLTCRCANTTPLSNKPESAVFHFLSVFSKATVSLILASSFVRWKSPLPFIALTQGPSQSTKKALAWRPCVKCSGRYYTRVAIWWCAAVRLGPASGDSHMFARYRRTKLCVPRPSDAKKGLGSWRW